MKIDYGPQYNLSVLNARPISLANLPYVYDDYGKRINDNVLSGNSRNLSDATRQEVTNRFNPENLYAEIKVEGRIVATVWKNGGVTIDPKYRDIAVQSESIKSAQERVDFLVNTLSAEASYFTQSNSDQAYSFSEAMAKITQGYKD